MKRSVNRWSGLALVVAMMAALAACGRKGPLDPPPSAGLTPPPAYTQRPSLGEENYGPAPPPGDPARTAVAPPAATAPPPPKTFPLDFLLAK